MQQSNITSTLVKELDLGSLPPETQQEIIVRLGEMCLREITISTLEKLAPADYDEMNRLQAAGDQDALYAFLSTRIPDYDLFVANTVKKAIDEFKSMRDQFLKEATA